jgi:glycerol kinase
VTAEALVVAIDAGTTGVRSLAVSTAGVVTDVAYRELTQHFPRPGWVEHDPAEIWSAVRDTLAQVVAGLPEEAAVAAVGITNQRETVVAWDRRTGQPLHRAIVWQDRRTVGRCEALGRAGYLPLVRARTGLVLDPYFSGTKMAWLLEEGGLGRTGPPPGDLVLGTVDSWVLWNLTGGSENGVLATDASNASRTMLYDIDARRWSEELCGILGVPAAALPIVGPSCGRFGTVAAGGGPPALTGVPVSGIAGDQQAALFGQACFVRGTAKATFGTGSFVLANAGAERPPVPEGLLTTVAWDLGDHAGGHAPFVYALEGSAFTSGAAIQWLRDGLGVIGRAEETGPLAASVPDAGGVSVVPAFTGMGSPWWDPRARGTVTGITRGTGRAQLARAVVEALAYQVRAMVDAMNEATGQPVSVLRADGGAAAMDLLLQLEADQIGVPVARPASLESTALGAATLAGLAEGVWASLEELEAMWHPAAERHPQAARADADAAFAAWLRAVERARDWADE